MTTHRLSRRWLPWLAGTLALAGVTLAFNTEYVPAQAKKADPKKAEKAEVAKKEPKAEGPPANFPKRKDLMDGSRGGTDQVAYIDEQILQGWKDNKTFPSDRCSDYEFIRRASL